MENTFFLKIEIIVFFISLIYIIYYLIIKLWPKKLLKFRIKFFKKVKFSKQPNNNLETKNPVNKISLNSKKNELETNTNNWKNKLSEKDKTKINEIIKKVKNHSSKWYFDTAKNLIVEWLSIDKYNKDLNLELAKIYEKEHNYINAEYIYKDMLDMLKVDTETMKRLWYIYAMQNKLKESLEMYEKIHAKKMSDDEVIDLLSELTFNMKSYKKALKYINLFLVSKPRNVDKLFMKWKCLRELWKMKDASEVYKRILDLQPYNTRAKEIMERIESNYYVINKNENETNNENQIDNKE